VFLNCDEWTDKFPSKLSWTFGKFFISIWDHDLHATCHNQLRNNCFLLNLILIRLMLLRIKHLISTTTTTFYFLLVGKICALHTKGWIHGISRWNLEKNLSSSLQNHNWYHFQYWASWMNGLMNLKHFQRSLRHRTLYAPSQVRSYCCEQHSITLQETTRTG